MTATHAIAYLRSPLAIRARCEAIFEAALAGTLDHVTVDLNALPVVIDEVVRVTRDERTRALPTRIESDGTVF